MKDARPSQHNHANGLGMRGGTEGGSGGGKEEGAGRGRRRAAGSAAPERPARERGAGSLPPIFHPLLRSSLDTHIALETHICPGDPRVHWRPTFAL